MKRNHRRLPLLQRVRHRGTHNALLDIEELSEADLLNIRRRYERLAAQARKNPDKGGRDQGTPEL